MQRIWIINRNPRLTFCPKLLQILAPCVLSPPPPTTADLPPHASCFPSPHTVHGERIWSSFRRQKVERGLLLLIHILWLNVSFVLSCALHSSISSFLCIFSPPKIGFPYDLYLICSHFICTLNSMCPLFLPLHIHSAPCIVHFMCTQLLVSSTLWALHPMCPPTVTSSSTVQAKCLHARYAYYSLFTGI
jgi:hypothetical protein